MFRSLDRTGPVPSARRRQSRRARTAAVCSVGGLAVLLLATGCGRGNGDAIIFDGPMTTTTRVDASSDTTASTEPAGPALGPWKDVTGNLAGMASECGNMSQVAGWRGTDLVIAGVAQQGLWVTNAQSDQWTRLDAGSPTQIRNRTVSVIVDPANPQQFWESGSYGGPGVVRTSDGGRTFQGLGQAVDNAEGLSIDLTDPERRTLLVGIHEQPNLFRSTDGGATWANVAPELDGAFAHYPIVVNRDVHLLGANGLSGGGIYRTTDGGATWAQVGEVAVAGQGLLASNGSIYWALSNGSMVQSTDGGATWTKVLQSGSLSSSSNVIELSDGRLAAVGARTVVMSQDNGATWRALGPRLSISDPKGVAYSEAGNAVYVWSWDCGDVVPPRSVQRLDLTQP